VILIETLALSQTRMVEELAAHNLHQANQSRQLLIRMQVAAGNRLVDEGDYSNPNASWANV
jgi:hypothetical protein